MKARIESTCNFIAYEFNSFIFAIKLQKLKSSLGFLLDKVGIFTSIFCIIHCLAVPFLLLFGLDSLLRMADQEWIEWLLIACSFIIGLISFLRGFLTHRQHHIPILFVAGLLLLINSESVSHFWVSLTLSITGASVIIYAHLQNLRFQRVN